MASRRAALALLSLLAVEAAALSALVASAQPPRTLPMRRVAAEVEDRPATTPNYSEAAPKHVVIEGALP